ncbi:MAG: 16S rRNA (adenine(1518)-N(6)/adenine(1519)-N(6))-dimethyltransferase RsmA [Verrucomicrobiota bacterium]
MPLSPTETKELLEQLGHHPVKKLGQNFLIDGNIVRKSLELANIQKADTVVEVGPGLGTLTQALLHAGARVYAIERDRRLAAHVRTIESQWEGQLTLTEGDAMEYPLAQLPKEIQSFKIVANLPYAISTPWMEAVTNNQLPVSMTLMLQKEAAARFAAPPGNKLFGSISIFLQAAYDTPAKHDVAANCFYPRPDVGSRLLHLQLKEKPFIFNKESKLLIREVFQQRRKQIGTTLRKSALPLSAAWLDKLPSLSIDLQARPEQLELDRWIALASEP